MPLSESYGTLIAFDFADCAGKREQVPDDGSIASIHEIIPYLIRSISLTRGLNVLSDKNIADGGGLELYRNQNSPQSYRLNPSVLPSKPLGTSIQRPRYTTKDSID